MAKGTALGAIAKPIMESGALVPDDLVTKMLKERLAEKDAAGGAIFDGYPRTVAQARSLDALLEGGGRQGGRRPLHRRPGRDARRHGS